MGKNPTHGEIFRDLVEGPESASPTPAAERAYTRLETIDRELCELLTRTFGRDYAIRWLFTPTTALGYQKPWRMLGQCRRTDVVRVIEAFASGK